jgi:AraC family ethanolamine operon transcriptional activator
MTTAAREAEANESSATPPLAVVGKMDVDDPCLYEQASKPWELIATPLERGRFGHHKTYLVSRSLVLYHETFAQCIQVQGLTPPGMLGFAIPLRLGPRSRFWKSELSGNGLPATLPGGLDVVLEARQSQLMVLMALSWIRAGLPEPVVSSLEEAAASHLFPIPAQSADRLGCWLLLVLQNVNCQPDLLRHPLVVRLLEEELLDRLVETIQPLCPNIAPPNGRVRRRGLERAFEFLRMSDLANLTVGQLCEAAGVSQRTLEYAFRECLGLTPLGFLRLHRLHAARRDLAATLPGEVTVSDIAYRHGFFELGRFASCYKRLFGELPSQTLASPARKVMSPLILSP